MTANVIYSSQTPQQKTEMKILITGKIGRYLAPELARDHEVHGIDILPSDWRPTPPRPIFATRRRCRLSLKAWTWSSI